MDLKIDCQCSKCDCKVNFEIINGEELLNLIQDLNEILTRERDSLRDENIELQKRVKKLELKIQELEKIE